MPHQAWTMAHPAQRSSTTSVADAIMEDSRAPSASASHLIRDITTLPIPRGICFDHAARNFMATEGHFSTPRSSPTQSRKDSNLYIPC